MSVTPELLLEAYRSGIFPMAEHKDDPEIFWVDPRKRGIFPLDGFKISRSLRKQLIREEYSVTLNKSFSGVVEACANREDTWISAEIHHLYTGLHKLNRAHSLEVWREGALIGGVYGVTLGAAFFGESMFSRRTDGSKVALSWLIAHLRACGFTLFDTQFLTPHLASLGAIEITRAQYHKLLAEAVGKQADILSRDLPKSAQDVVHPRTQTS